MKDRGTRKLGQFMRTIAIVNQKGGSGKTTTTVNLGAALAELGKKVLLIDLDPQSSTSLWYGFKDKGRGLFDVFTSTSKKFIEAVEKTKYEGLDIIPSSPLLAGVEKMLVTHSKAEVVLKEKLDKHKNKKWDYILIDCPPTLGVLSLNALAAAKEVVVPVETHVMALHGLVQLLKTINHVKEKVNPALRVTGILPCRVNCRTKHSHEVIGQLKQRFADQVYNSFIRENIKIAEAPLHMLPVIHYETKCNGSEDYRKLAKEMIGQE